MNDLAKEYFDAILQNVDFDDKCGEHLLMLNRLNEIIFTVHPRVSLDENLILLVQNMREDFIKETCCNREMFLEQLENSSPSVLEILAKLAIDTSNAFYFDDKTGQIFWLFMENLGLMDAYDDYSISNEIGESVAIAEIDGIIENFLDRKYDKNGENGGIIHLSRLSNNTNFDYEIGVNLMPLWYQINRFISSMFF